MALSRGLGWGLALGLGALLGHGLTRAASPTGEEPSRVEALSLQVSRLEHQVSRLEALRAGTREALPSWSAPAAPPVASVDSEALRAEVAQVLREELAALREASGEAPATAPTPSLTSLAAAQQAHRFVDLGVGQGRWREDQARELGRLLGDMTEAERDEVLQRLVQAINRGELRPDSPRLIQ